MMRLDPAFLFGLQIEQLLAAGCILVSIVYGLRTPRTRPAAREARLTA